MILVDTSVWVTAFRSGQSFEAQHLRDRLDDNVVTIAIPVRIEILSGVSGRDRVRVHRALSALPVYAPTDATWSRIEEWIDRAGQSGERFGFADLLIAAIAAENNLEIWSLDADFERMKALGFVSLYQPKSGKT